MSEKVKANDHESYTTYTIIAFLIPIVGIIMGIVYAAKDRKLEKKLGEHLIVISILFMILQSIFFFFVWGPSPFLTTTTSTTPSIINEVPLTSNWDPADYYEKIKKGQTKTQVEKITGRKSQSCTTSKDSYIGTLEICDYGDLLSDKGTLSITYINGKVDTKTKVVP